MMIYRGGPGSVSAAEVRIDRSGRITLTSGLMDVGEGASTVLPQMAADCSRRIGGRHRYPLRRLR